MRFSNNHKALTFSTIKITAKKISTKMSSSRQKLQSSKKFAVVNEVEASTETQITSTPSHPSR